MRRATSSSPSRPARRLVCLAAAAAAQLAGAEAGQPHRGHRGHRAVEAARPSPASPDAVGLGTLAPPTRLSTLEQTYGDAAYARARAARRDDALVGPRADAAPSAAVLFPCEPRSAGTAAYRCGPASAVPGYGLAYAFNPAYVTSPFASGHDPREQAPVLPGVTGLFYAINGLAAGHGD